MLKSKLGKVLAVCAACALCALAVSGCGSKNAANDTNLVAATYNGDAQVMEVDVTNAIDKIRAQNGLEGNDDAWGQMLSMFGMTPASLREQQINSIIDQHLIVENAKEFDIEVDDEFIDEQVADIASKFDSQEAWEKARDKAGFTEESYRWAIQSAETAKRVQKHFEETTSVDEADLLEQAKTLAAQYDGGKRSSHILIKCDANASQSEKDTARKKAEDILKQIEDGADFAEMAKQYSEDTSAEDGGDVGWDKASSFVAEYTDALSKLEVGQVSGIVESQYGYHIIKCTETFTAPEEITGLDQLPESIRKDAEESLKSQKSNEAYTAWLDKLEEAANISINEMPSGLPYDIDMSKYQNDTSTTAEDGQTVEVQGGDDTVEVVTPEEAGSSQSASSSSASASAESASSSSSAASTE